MELLGRRRFTRGSFTTRRFTSAERSCCRSQTCRWQTRYGGWCRRWKTCGRNSTTLGTVNERCWPNSM